MRLLKQYFQEQENYVLSSLRSVTNTWKEVKNEKRGKREAADQVQRRLETDK